jgi:hypothetical protein
MPTTTVVGVITGACMKKLGDTGKTREPKPSGLGAVKAIAAKQPETKK